MFFFKAKMSFNGMFMYVYPLPHCTQEFCMLFLPLLPGHLEVKRGSSLRQRLLFYCLVDEVLLIKHIYSESIMLQKNVRKNFI